MKVKKKAQGVSLDPRRTRKLTSRECCAILGGYLGGMCTSDLVGVEAARSALEIWVEVDTEHVWESIRHQAKQGAGDVAVAIEESRSLQAKEADPGLRVFWRGLGALVSGLRTLASEKAVKTALTWLYVNDAFWPKKKVEEQFEDIGEGLGAGSVQSG